MRLPAFLALSLVTLAGCNRGSEPAAPPASAPAPAAAPKPKPPPTLTALVASAVAVQPDGKEVSLFADEAPLVDPQSTFKLVFQRRLPDLRASLLEGDAMVPAEGSRDLAEGTTVTVKPTGGLQAQASYQLRVDGASTREAHDEDGNKFEPLLVLVRTGGEPPPPPPRPAAKKKKR